MSKVGGALPAWYWPDGIPRRSPVANQTLDRLIKRGSSRRAGEPAIVWPERSIAFDELLERATAIGQALTVLCPDDETLCLAEADPGEAYVLMLGTLAAGRRVLLCDPAAPAARTAAQTTEAGAAVVLTATGAGPAADAGRRVVTRAELDAFDGEPVKLRAVKANAGAILIPAGDELAMHSQYSVAAMATSLSAFIPKLRETPLVAPPPLWHWESLAAITATLAGGSAPVVVTALDGPAGDGALDTAGGHTVLLRSAADALIGAERTPPGIGALEHVFVSTDYFRPRWRRELEARVGHEVLPVWGTPELGPTVAAHPTWFPLAAHGIPLVNVRVVPVDPATGQTSVVPWEMLERAEIGVESPAVMTGFARKGADADRRSGNILRTFVNGSVDHVGVVSLEQPAGRGRRGGR